MWFWQISDTHMDPELGLLLCVYNQHSVVKVPKKGYENVTAGQFGAFQCDLPQEVVENALQFIGSSEFQDTFVLWTMDVSGSQMFKQTEKKTLEVIATEIQLFYKYLPNQRVFPCAGNHDYHPITQVQIFLQNRDNLLSGVLPPNVTGCFPILQNYWLPEDALATVALGGYYTVILEDGLRLVTLNSDFFDFLNITDPEWDPAGQFSWFEEILSEARTNQEKVIVFGHHAPGIVWETGMPNTIASYTDRMISLISDYADIVVGTLFGHAHRDDFRLPLSYPDANLVMFLGPSLTPKIDVFPSVRLFEYDAESKNLTDWEQYYYDIDKANTEGQITWELLYSPLSLYNMTDISKPSWENLLERMENNCDLFQAHWLAFNQGNPSAPGCDCDSCKRKVLCMEVSATREEYEDCLG